MVGYFSLLSGNRHPWCSTVCFSAPRAGRPRDLEGGVGTFNGVKLTRASDVRDNQHRKDYPSGVDVSYIVECRLSQ